MTTKIEKLKNFNQILLAIAGVIGILFLIAVCSLFIIDFWPRDHQTEGMIADEEVEILNEQGLRKEIVSFERFQVVDSANQVYVLPVTQASLDNPESSEKTLGLMNDYRGSGYYKELVYNNFVIHYGKTDSSLIVFKDRLSIGEFMITKNKKFLLASGCDNDSNHDKFLNSNDLQKLYTFNIQTRKTEQIETPENYTLIHFYEPLQSNIILCKFGVDRNKNGVFENTIEPNVFMQLNQNNMSLEPFVDNNQIDALQKILEGK